jgi:uncharacterized membrane protein
MGSRERTWGVTWVVLLVLAAVAVVLGAISSALAWHVLAAILLVASLWAAWRMRRAIDG